MSYHRSSSRDSGGRGSTSTRSSSRSSAPDSDWLVNALYLGTRACLPDDGEFTESMAQHAISEMRIKLNSSRHGGVAASGGGGGATTTATASDSEGGQHRSHKKKDAAMLRKRVVTLRVRQGAACVDVVGGGKARKLVQWVGGGSSSTTSGKANSAPVPCKAFEQIFAFHTGPVLVTLAMCVNLGGPLHRAIVAFQFESREAADNLSNRILATRDADNTHQQEEEEKSGAVSKPVDPSSEREVKAEPEVNAEPQVGEQQNETEQERTDRRYERAMQAASLAMAASSSNEGGEMQERNGNAAVTGGDEPDSVRNRAPPILIDDITPEFPDGNHRAEHNVAEEEEEARRAQAMLVLQRSQEAEERERQEIHGEAAGFVGMNYPNNTSNNNNNNNNNNGGRYEDDDDDINALFWDMTGSMMMMSGNNNRGGAPRGGSAGGSGWGRAGGVGGGGGGEMGGEEWEEDVKILRYDGHLRRAIEDQDGSIFMFTARQIVPNQMQQKMMRKKRRERIAGLTAF